MRPLSLSLLLACADPPAAPGTDTDALGDAADTVVTDTVVDTPLADTGLELPPADTEPPACADTDAAPDPRLLELPCPPAEDTGRPAGWSPETGDSGGDCGVKPLTCACDLTCELAALEVVDESVRWCTTTSTTCTDAGGRALVVHARTTILHDAWGRPSDSVVQELYFDAADGTLVAIHEPRGPTPCTGDRWFGEHVRGCEPDVAPVLVACDTDALCDDGEDVALDLPSAAACDAWPGGRALVAPTTLDLSGTTVDEAEPYALGDVTGDGVDDLMVFCGLNPGDESVNFQDDVHVYAGGPGVLDLPLDAVEAHTVLDAEPTVWFRAFAAGDFDGDGHRDLALASPNRRIAGTGQVWIFRGPLAPGTLTVEDADVDLRGSSDHAYLAGLSLVNVGDVDGDGDDDLVVEAEDDGWHALHVVDLDADTRGPVRLVDVSTWWRFGRRARAVAAGDLDGDGQDDLALVGPDEHGDDWYGAVRLVRGPVPSRAGDVTGLPATVLVGPWIPHGHGLDVQIGDPDHDGVRELFVADDLGLSRVVGWPSTGWYASVAVARRAAPAGMAAHVPLPFLLVDDRDGDGVDDLVLGAPDEGRDRTCEAWGDQRVATSSAQGAAQLVRSDLSCATAGTLLGHALDEHLGRELRDLGDVDGDGARDLLVRGIPDVSGDDDPLPAWSRLPTCP